MLIIIIAISVRSITLKNSTQFFSEENETEEDNVRSLELCLLAKLGQKNLMSHCHENGIDMVKILS
jgi:hypothetical protein